MEEKEEVKTEEKAEKEEIEELDVSRDQAQIVSMLRIQNLENLLVEKGLLSEEEILKNFETINSNFVVQLTNFARTRRESE